MSELEMYKKMYITLVNGGEDVIKYINDEMMIPQAYDWDHTRQILLIIQQALQKAEDIYVDCGESA